MGKIRVMVVDDEPMVRAGMRSIVNWEEHGYEIVAEVANGMQALEMIEKTCPHIVLTDLIMPVMDGIELIKTAKQRKFNCKFIILSCVAEAGALQEALNLGVSRYALKHTVCSLEILKLVDEVSSEIVMDAYVQMPENARINQDLRFNEYINSVFEKKLNDGEKTQKILNSFLNKAPSGLLIAKAENSVLHSKSIAMQSVASVVQNIVEDMGGGYSYVNTDNYICTFVYECGTKELQSLCMRISNTVSDCFDISLNFACYAKAVNAENLSAAYEDCLRQLSEKFYEQELAPSTGKEENDYTQMPLKFGPNDSFEHTAAALNSAKALFLSTAMKEKEVQKVYLSILDFVMKSFDKSKEEIMRDMKLEIEPEQYVLSSKSFEEMHLRLLEIIRALYLVVGYYELHSDKNIDAILDYVDENCMLKIKLTDIAERLHFRPDYVCKMFKKKTGVNLVDHIMHKKIEKSKELLANGLSISEISERLEFSSDSHFSKTFKRYTKQLPSDYRTIVHTK